MGAKCAVQTILLRRLSSTSSVLNMGSRTSLRSRPLLYAKSTLAFVALFPRTVITETRSGIVHTSHQSSHSFSEVELLKPHTSQTQHIETKTDKMHFAINTLVLATLAASQAYAASISHQHSAFHSHARKHNHVEQKRATALTDSDASKLSALGVASLGVNSAVSNGQAWLAEDGPYKANMQN